jgi:hypothetical protein
MNANYLMRFLVAAIVSRVCVFAAPPLITGDVSTATANSFELYVGSRYQKTDAIDRQVPHIELIYGLTPKWEASIETNYLSLAGEHGFDDTTLGTKVAVIEETITRPAFGLSYDVKFSNGDAERGLGSGGTERDVRMRAKKSFGPLIVLMNIGRVFVSDVRMDGDAFSRSDAWRASFAQEWELSRKLKILGEVYSRESTEPGAPARTGWNIGVKQRLRENLSWHAAYGGSLRRENRGGLDLRIYAGLKIEFSAPWSGTSP